MIKIITADITKLKNIDVIVNAANGRGVMGRGVAGAIGRAIGDSAKKNAKVVCESNRIGFSDNYGFTDGECYISSSGNLIKSGINHIYHAVTMEYPGGRTSMDIISKAMRSTLELAIKNGIKSIAFPALGTGVGCLDKKQVASRMVDIAEHYSDKIDITLVDIDEEFIDFAKMQVQTEKVR